MNRVGRNGFTLVELLTVISIIAVLAGMLFPVFTSAQESARRTQCLSQLKQISLATTMYSDENNGMLPPYGALNWNNLFVMRAALKRDSANNVGIWHCPSDHGYRPHNVAPSFFAVYGSSYLFNGNIYLAAYPANTAKSVGTCRSSRTLILFWDWVSHPVDNLWTQNVAFGDGHVKGMDYRALAQGVNVETLTLWGTK